MQKLVRYIVPMWDTDDDELHLLGIDAESADLATVAAANRYPNWLVGAVDTVEADVWINWVNNVATGCAVARGERSGI